MRISDWSSDVCSSDLMADQHILADDRREALGAVRHRAVAMNDAAVLNVRSRTDDDMADVGAQHAIIPDADVGPDRHIADDTATRREEGAGVDPRRLAVDADVDEVVSSCGARKGVGWGK